MILSKTITNRSVFLIFMSYPVCKKDHKFHVKLYFSNMCLCLQTREGCSPIIYIVIIAMFLVYYVERNISSTNYTDLRCLEKGEYYLAKYMN